eukprot:scaffold304444_cov31-Tisochrysis_lutea.AAC.2
MSGSLLDSRPIAAARAGATVAPIDHEACSIFILGAPLLSSPSHSLMISTLPKTSTIPPARLIPPTSRATGTRETP